MKKLIIGLAVSALIISVTLIIFYVARNKTVQNNEELGDNSPQLSAPVLPGSQKVQINEQNLSQSIQENIESVQESSEGEQDTKFQDTRNQPLVLDQFKTGANIIIKPEIYNNLSQTDFSVFTCDRQPNEEGFGIIMRFKAGTTAAYYADLYEKMDNYLADWEGTIFQDLSPLLFSNKKISQRPKFLSSEYTTENGAATIDVRYANVKTDDGMDASIDYAVHAEDVYIFNNPQCLRKALDKHQPVLEP